MKTWIALALLGLTACSHPEAASTVTKIALVRHAEKVTTDGSEDPPLTERGAQRAEGLVSAVGDLPINAIYCTQYQRTRATVAPVARARALEIKQVDAGDTKGFAQKLLTEHRGQTVLAAAHSDTLPEIVAALGISEPLVLGDADYGDVFLVSIDAAGKATLVKRRFGD